LRREDLPQDWNALPEPNSTRQIGTKWATEKRSAVLGVPSQSARRSDRPGCARRPRGAHRRASLDLSKQDCRAVVIQNGLNSPKCLFLLRGFFLRALRDCTGEPSVIELDVSRCPSQLPSGLIGIPFSELFGISRVAEGALSGSRCN
jgi:hypothetical protein